MEFINEIRIRGVVGRADVNTPGSRQVCNFSVVTEYSTVDRDGGPVTETSWFNVAAWEGRCGLQDLHSVQKGSWVEVIGRTRIRKYTTLDNEERTSFDVIARSVQVLPRDMDRMQPQRD